ncbi:hypothetical protein EDB81DRAFT_790817 [Dactylonectria macrodidyma]|uniref:Secreted protein n=1 Tax=Dactylonectria macrodidyma TaxID=307937 RepID=A0A9P9F6I6_9HYPO|nr:hypothetical protein EDB81DRAFT_790817 [Dactylonectria macrodidyma]
MLPALRVVFLLLDFGQSRGVRVHVRNTGTAFLGQFFFLRRRDGQAKGCVRCQHLVGVGVRPDVWELLRDCYDIGRASFLGLPDYCC